MKLENIKYIAVEGVIGAGKTSLAEKISETLSAKTIYEEFEQNPFLEEFYQDPNDFFQVLYARLLLKQELHLLYHLF